MATPAELVNNSSLTNRYREYEGFYGKTDLSYFGMHCHDFYEIYFHFGGGTKMHVDNATYDLQPNMLMIFPPFCMHGLTDALNLINYERGWLTLTPELVTYLGFRRLDLNAILTDAVQNETNQFRLDNPDAMECKKLIQRICANQQNQNDLSEFDSMSCISSILSIVLRTIGNKKATVAPVPPAQLMHSILAYINDHYTEPLELQAIADRFHISVSLLSHNFTAYTNRSLYDYILYRRISLAQMMLRSNRPLGEISSLCGFSDYSGFLRKFTAMFGMSPKEYRNNLKRHGLTGD